MAAAAAPARAGAIARPSLAAAQATAEAEWRAMDAMLRSLPPAAWSTPTSCRPWTVGDLVAHVVGQYEGAARPWVMLRRIRTARRTHPGLGPLDGQNAVQVEERAGLTPDELVALHADRAPRGVRALARMPWFVRRTRLSRVFPEALEQPEDSLDFLVRVLAARDAWMHRLDVADATGIPILAGAHDEAQLQQLLKDVATGWTGPAALLELTGPGSGAWTVGSGVPVAVLRADGLDLARHLAGRQPLEQLQLEGDAATVAELRLLRLPF